MRLSRKGVERRAKVHIRGLTNMPNPAKREVILDWIFATHQSQKRKGAKGQAYEGDREVPKTKRFSQIGKPI